MLVGLHGFHRQLVQVLQLFNTNFQTIVPRGICLTRASKETEVGKMEKVDIFDQ